MTEFSIAKEVEAAMMFAGDKTDQTALVKYAQSLERENERMKSALHKIERMKTYPSHAMNTVTLCAARAFARQGLGIPQE